MHDIREVIAKPQTIWPCEYMKTPHKYSKFPVQIFPHYFLGGSKCPFFPFVRLSDLLH